MKRVSATDALAYLPTYTSMVGTCLPSQAREQYWILALTWHETTAIINNNNRVTVGQQGNSLPVPVLLDSGAQELVAPDVSPEDIFV